MPFVLTLPSRAVLRIAGDDRITFLQGLVSNDVTRVSPIQGIYAAFLTAQGKYLHDFFLASVGDALVLDGEAERLADLKRRLSMYRLRAKVTIDDASDLAVAVAWPGDAASALGLSSEVGAARAIDGGVAFIDPRLANLGARIIAPAAVIAALPGQKDGRFEDCDRLRLLNGIPDGSRDLVPEKSILLENGFDELNGVDWKKGCYIGQELTARTKYRGLIKKRLLPVTIEGPPPETGTPILLGEAEAGEMRSATDGLGLALLRLEQLEAASQTGAPLTAGAARLYPSKPDWLRL